MLRGENEAENALPAYGGWTRRWSSTYRFPFSTKQVDLLMDGAKTVLTLSSAFLTIVVGSVSYLARIGLTTGARGGVEVRAIHRSWP